MDTEYWAGLSLLQAARVNEECSTWIKAVRGIQHSCWLQDSHLCIMQDGWSGKHPVKRRASSFYFTNTYEKGCKALDRKRLAGRLTNTSYQPQIHLIRKQLKGKRHSCCILLGSRELWGPWRILYSDLAKTLQEGQLNITRICPENRAQS